MMWNGNGYGSHGAGWEAWLMLMFMILFVVALIVAIVFLVRYLAQPQAAQTQLLPPQAAQAAPAVAAAPEAPKDILKRRYVAGEIEREEYLQKLGDL